MNIHVHILTKHILYRYILFSGLKKINTLTPFFCLFKGNESLGVKRPTRLYNEDLVFPFFFSVKLYFLLRHLKGNYYKRDYFLLPLWPSSSGIIMRNTTKGMPAVERGNLPTLQNVTVFKTS